MSILEERVVLEQLFKGKPEKEIMKNHLIRFFKEERTENLAEGILAS